jgi:hypothetical protein
MANLFRTKPTKICNASTNANKNAVTRDFAIAQLASARASRVTLVHHASVPLAPMIALDMELAVLTGTLLTTGLLQKPNRLWVI